MCRKNQLQGACLMAFAVGLMVGHSLESWFLCCCGGLTVLVFGFVVFRRRR